MKNSCFVIAILLFAFASCKKPETPSLNGDTPLPSHHDPVYNIGDYFHNDTLQGIVFFTTAGGTTGLMVSHDETFLPWCQPNYINFETAATNPFDGWTNTNVLMANYDLSRYPAIRWSHRKNTWHLVHDEHKPVNRKQWYVPSSGELSRLLQNQALVNATLDSLGYPTLEGKTYWSSTETSTRTAAAGHVQNDVVVINDSLKTQAFYVRAIRNF